MLWHGSFCAAFWANYAGRQWCAIDGVVLGAWVLPPAILSLISSSNSGRFPW
jgi:hypothetical protein